MNQYTEIVKMVKDVAREEELRFDDPVQVKRTPHDSSFNVWGVQSTRGHLLVMDSNEDWFTVTDTDTLIVQSLYQRLSLITNQKAA